MSGMGIYRDGKRLCNFEVAVTQIYRWADGPNCGALAFIDLHLRSDAGCYQERVPAECIGKLEFLKRHPDLCLYQRRYRDGLSACLSERLSEYLQRNTGGLAFCQTGLHRLEKGAVFVAGNRVIGGCEVDAIFSQDIARLHLEPARYESGRQAEELLERLQANDPFVTTPVFAFGILTALQSLVLECGIPLASVLYISGRSGLGKTETVKRFFAVYDQDNTGRPALITEAGSTMAGFRENLRAARDLPVVLDDLCLSTGKDSQRKRLQTGAQVIREASNKGAVRTKAGGHGMFPSTEAGVAITAEFDMQTVSDVTRCIIVSLDHPMKGGRTDDRSIAAGALSAFLEWFLPRYEQEAQLLRERYQATTENKRLDRLATGQFCLQWAFERFMRFGVETGATDETCYKETIRFFDRTLKIWNKKQKQILDRIESAIIKESIPCLLWKGIQKKIIPVHQKLKKLEEGYAVIRGQDLFLPPGVAEWFISVQNGYRGINRNRIGRALKLAGVLVTHESDKANTVKPAQGFHRVYHIRLDQLEKAALFETGGNGFENSTSASTFRGF